MDTTARLAVISPVVGFSRRLCLTVLALQLTLAGSSAAFLSIAPAQEEGKVRTENIPFPQGVQAPFIAAEWINDRGGLMLASEVGLYEWHFPDWFGATTNSAFAVPSQVGLESHVERVFDLRRSPNHEWIAIAGGIPGDSGMLEIWRLRDKRLLHRWTVEGDVIYQVDWDQSSRRIAAAGANGVCSVFDFHGTVDVVQYHGHSSGVTTISVMRDERTVVSGAIDQTIHLWSLETGRGIRVLDNHAAPVRCLIQGPRSTEVAKGTILSGSEDRTVRLWQPQLGRLVRFAKLPSGVSAMEAMVNRADNSPASELLPFVVGCDDGTLHRVDATAMKSERMEAPNLGRVYRLLRCSHALNGKSRSVLVAIAAKGAYVIY